MTDQPEDMRTGGFGRKHRLRRGNSFARIFQDGQCVVGRTVVVRVMAAEAAWSRCGVIASKRTFRRAVDRNRAKRLLREAFRRERAFLPVACDVILIARKRILDDSVSAVIRDLQHIERRIDWTQCRGEG